MDSERATTERTGVPEFTELGKRIEVLRIERGLSKQHLARSAGTSRQQLWRVMTGKSDMSLALRHRLMDALGVETLEPPKVRRASIAPIAHRPTPETFSEFATSPSSIEHSLAAMPAGADGKALKRRYLDAIEDVALDAGIPLPADFFDLRRRVLSGDL